MSKDESEINPGTMRPVMVKNLFISLLHCFYDCKGMARE